MLTKNIKLYFPPINKLGNNVFRNLLLKYKCDFVFTEMIRIEKILELEQHQLKKLKIDENKINQTFIQILSENENNIEKGIDLIMKLNPNIKEINYNMGCPQSSLCKNENGCGITNNPNKIKAVSIKLKKACDKYNIIPSIKIRLGLTRNNITIYDNINIFKQIGINKIYIHGRTLSDTYNKPATYEEIKKIKLENPNMEIIGNGDVKDLNSLNNILKTNCDGILIGRAALENPNIFQKLKQNNFKKYKSGIKLKYKKQILIDFINLAKEDNDISISQIKANINYITKNTINSSKFRKQINNSKDIINIEKKILDIN